MQDQIWLKKVLVPFWAIQLILFTVLFIISCFALSLVDNNDSDLDGGHAGYM
jgi:riboflavin transporter FmnP